MTAQPPSTSAAGANAPAAAAAFADGPLQGVRIIDLTTVVLGPYATRILADMGADVVKVETFGGDQTRHYLPMRNAGMSGYFLNLNRNKRSIALDLKKADGLAALKKLIAGAHAFVHNMRPHDAHLQAVGLFRSEQLRHHAPRLGEHSAQLLREAGYGDDAIGAMVGDASVLEGR